MISYSYIADAVVSMYDCIHHIIYTVQVITLKRQFKLMLYMDSIIRYIIVWRNPPLSPDLIIEH